MLSHFSVNVSAQAHSPEVTLIRVMYTLLRVSFLAAWQGSLLTLLT